MKRVEQFLEDLRVNRGDLYPVVARIRGLALASGPAITEEFKYGGIVFASKTGFCGVFVYQAHVTLEFSEGSTLADPFGVLEGKGKHRRHIRLTAEPDIETRHVEAYLHAARKAADETA